jgi:hypothetical protein
MRIKSFLFVVGIFFLTIIVFPQETFACESCTIPNLGRNRGAVTTESKDKKWFFKYLFEQQEWEKLDIQAAHELHEDGRDIHVKTTQDFHHFSLGNHVTENLTVFTEIPYVIRRSKEIEDATILGSNQKSEGWGDLFLFGDYAFFKENNKSASFVGGVKFPTGSTNRLNSVGDKFELELQPGTGSVDYVTGGVYKQQMNRVELLANMVYVFKTEGARDFKFGDLFSTSLFVDYLINPDSKMFNTKVGIDANLQYEQKQKDNGSKVSDSGGTTILLGPALTIGATRDIAIFSSVMFPVYQNLGGVHQELDYTWTLGAKLNW